MRPALIALSALVPLGAPVPPLVPGAGPGPAALEAQQVVDPSVRVTSRVLLENDRVLVVENTYETGGVTEEHTHTFPRTVYVVSGGILELATPDGAVTQIEVRRGDALWRPSETHVVRNVGPTRVTVVETEIKGTAGS